MSARLKVELVCEECKAATETVGVLKEDRDLVGEVRGESLMRVSLILPDGWKSHYLTSELHYCPKHAHLAR